MSENLDLWRKVERTDPTQTKKITGKAYQGNSPKPHFLIFKATETFGPCGLGWGFDIVEEKLLDGALLDPGFYERIHMARVRVWYEWNGKRGQVEHVGQTLFCGRRKGDSNKPGLPFTDEDAPKKSVTDALIKALSMIGFAGDIFMGRYDDSKYVEALTKEFAEERRIASRPAELAQDSDPAETPDDVARRHILDCERAIDAADDRDTLAGWWNSDARKNGFRQNQLTADEGKALADQIKRRLDDLPVKTRAAA